MPLFFRLLVTGTESTTRQKSKRKSISILAVAILAVQTVLLVVATSPIIKQKIAMPVCIVLLPMMMVLRISLPMLTIAI